MGFLYLLESIRNPVLDTVMSLVTRLGEETAFLVLALIVFWCVDKKKGYYIMTVGFIGTVASQFMKLMCRVPRPWVLDPEFTIVESAREAATGYSFPSGHSQSAVGTFGGLAATAKERWLRIAGIAIAVLVPLSRMYLGVHTPADVLVGSAISLVLLLAVYPVIFRAGHKGMKVLLPAMLALAIGQLLFVELYPFPADTDVHNLTSGVKNAYTLLGCVLGVCVVYFADHKWVNFPTEGTFGAQFAKVIVGLLLVLAVKEGLKTPLDALFAGHMAARAVRYFLVVVMAGLVWPLTFRWFSKRGKEK
jgi:membrane-associated phospholipid phosphatase